MAATVRALGKVRTTGRKWQASVGREKRDRADRDDAIREAVAQGATWDQLIEASGLSRPTIAKIVRKEQ